MDAVFNAVKRRIYMLDCFEGIDNDFYHDYEAPVPDVPNQKSKHVKACKHSSMIGKMHLHGITGFIQLKELYPETLPVLLAGELVHTGKNTGFGFGRYRIM